MTSQICAPFSYSDGPIEKCAWTNMVEIPEHPPLQGARTVDVAIIGAGFTGLNAALPLAEAGRSVAVVDANDVGWGASGRNGGFCCMGGSMANTARLTRQHGTDATHDYHLAERDAVTHTENLIDRFGWDVDRHSVGETVLAHSRNAAKAFSAEIEPLGKLLGKAPTIIAKQDLPHHGLGGAFHGAMNTPIGFALNPRKYLAGLAAAAKTAGAEIFGTTPVKHAERIGGEWHLSTPSGPLRAKQLVVATNGYSSENIPAWIAGRYLPVQSSIIVTRKLTAEELVAQGWTSAQMAYDTRKLLHYFRLLPDGRFLFGMRGGLNTTRDVHARIYTKIRRHFARLFPAWADVETPHYWSGFVCVSRDLTPFAGQVAEAEDLFAGFAYHGNGVAMGSYAGALIAETVLSRTDLRHPKVMKTPPKRFPLGPRRRLLMAPAYAVMDVMDL